MKYTAVKIKNGQRIATKEIIGILNLREIPRIMKATILTGLNIMDITSAKIVR